VPVVSTVLTEIAGLFPDVDMHLGFDEINQNCWWARGVRLCPHSPQAALCCRLGNAYFFLISTAKLLMVQSHRLSDERFKAYIAKNNFTVGDALQKYYNDLRAAMDEV
jgi:N-acetyl-beta-hexosaminidase